MGDLSVDEMVRVVLASQGVEATDARVVKALHAVQLAQMDADVVDEVVSAQEGQLAAFRALRRELF